VRVLGCSLHNHGALIDLDYLKSTNSRSPAFLIARVGYAYRVFTRAGRARLALTSHLSLSTGYSQERYPAPGVGGRSPVVGGRIGFDADFHLGRVLLGPTLSYELLTHTRGTYGLSHLLAVNVFPLRVGVALGESLVFPERAVADPPDGVSRKDQKLARQGRILLATGVPATAMAAIGGGVIAAKRWDRCGRGVVIATAGLGLLGLTVTAAGIIQMARASKAARRARLSKSERGGLITATLLGTAFSVAAVMTPAIGQGCLDRSW
jgi:multisubunit Na+/H+ antiporter MnhB subunit